MTGSSNAPPGIQLAPGTLLAERYKILRRIGGGGMGSVYLAEDQNLANRLVAVKEMVEMFADESARGKAIDDFKRESNLLASLDHPAIPTIYQYFLDASRGRYYLVMKYIEGGDLARRQEDLGGKVAEGVRTTGAALGLARRHGVEMPITEQMDLILHEGKAPLEAMRELMSRPGRDE